MITTISCTPPPIVQNLNRKLLMSCLERINWDIQNTLIPKANKKIRTQDIGKKRKFDNLLAEFKEVYERKKIEEAEYKTKIKEKIEKRSNFSNTGQTCIFKRMDT